MFSRCLPILCRLWPILAKEMSEFFEKLRFEKFALQASALHVSTETASWVTFIFCSTVYLDITTTRRRQTKDSSSNAIRWPTTSLCREGHRAAQLPQHQRFQAHRQHRSVLQRCQLSRHGRHISNFPKAQDLRPEPPFTGVSGPSRPEITKKSQKRSFWGSAEKSQKKTQKTSKNTDFRTYLGIFKLSRVFFETFLWTPKRTFFETFL